ncbi:MAG: hypothetical protein RLZZ127_39 [Planctomycetota bacterium]|jgi:Holliday junction resolvase RusA-like endonuclease
MMLQVTIPGIPIGKGRPRSSLRRSAAGGTFIHHHTPEKTQRWESMAAVFIRARAQGMRFDGPLELSYVAVFPRPQRLMAKKHGDGRIPHTAKPDIDNIAKALMDAMQKAQALNDDAQVFSVAGVKFYADRAEAPHLSFILTPPTPGLPERTMP